MINFQVNILNSDIKLRFDSVSAKEIAKVFLDDIKSNFEESRDVRGGSLVPLSLGTIEAKRKKGSILPGKVFYDTGQSYNAPRLRGNKRYAEIYIRDSRRRSDVTNTDILDFQKIRFNRQVFGISERAIERIKQRYLNGR